MRLPCNELTSVTTGAESGNGTTPSAHTPIPVEATLYWWRTDRNRFGTAPAEQIRFRCVGKLTFKDPRRYRVELAQALQRLPELTQRELKELGMSLAAAISSELGVEVAPIAGDVIDLGA